MLNSLAVSQSAMDKPPRQHLAGLPSVKEAMNYERGSSKLWQGNWSSALKASRETTRVLGYQHPVRFPGFYRDAIFLWPLLIC
jgi:hypothetical protein